MMKIDPGAIGFTSGFSQEQKYFTVGGRITVMDAPSSRAREQAPRWDLVATEGCDCGIRFLALYLIVWGYLGIYRRKEYVGGATEGPRGWRARLGG